MTINNIIRLHRIYNILLSISIILSGICLIAGCLTIYFTGEHTYSREIVAETFSKIAVPLYICIVLTIGGFIWEFIQPSQMRAIKNQKPYLFIMKRLSAKKDFSQCDKQTLTSINKERSNRKHHVCIRSTLIIISGIAFLAYALNGKHYNQSEINQSMIHAMCVLLPCMLVPFIYAVFTAYYNNKSLQREIEIIKQVPALKNTIAEELNKTSEKSMYLSEKKENFLRYSLLVVGAAILVYGFISGGTVDVLTKAINICTECIGLG